MRKNVTGKASAPKSTSVQSSVASEQSPALLKANRTLRELVGVLGAQITAARQRASTTQRWARSGCDAADELAGAEPAANRKAALRATVVEAVRQLGELCSEAELRTLTAAVTREDWAVAGHEFARIEQKAQADRAPLSPAAVGAPAVENAAAHDVGEANPPGDDGPDDAGSGGEDADRRPLLDDEALLPSVELARVFQLPHVALRKRLDRWRLKNLLASGEDWTERADRGPRTARYLYRVGAIRRVVDDLRARVQAGSERAAKKN